MKIAFFTEMNFTGKIPRSYENMRVEFAWMCALNADHYNYRQTPNEKYDLGIVIIPKKDPNFDINKLKPYLNKTGIMQEGPNWYWQDYSIERQIWYFNTLVSSDIIFVHNEQDKKYYKGLTGHNDVRVLRSVMIEDAIGEIEKIHRSGVIIGGNFVSWYGGFDSYIVANEISPDIKAPSSGRKIEGENQIINHIPYTTWKNWIHELNKFKYGVHLMRTHAAGTFALNCAYLGIPCIGYKGLDTQEICHPDLTVDISDLEYAKSLAFKLATDEEFYLYCSNTSKKLYLEIYHENKFNTAFEKQFKVS